MTGRLHMILINEVCIQIEKLTPECVEGLKFVPRDSAPSPNQEREDPGRSSKWCEKVIRKNPAHRASLVESLVPGDSNAEFVVGNDCRGGTLSICRRRTACEAGDNRKLYLSHVVF
jgi:hypothetical protein